MSTRGAWEKDQLVVEFESIVTMHRFFSESRSQDGFLLALERSLPLFTQVSAQCRETGGFDFSVKLEVLQVFERQDPGHFDTAFRVVDWSAVPTSTLERLSNPKEASAEPQTDTPESEVSPHFRIREMKPPERYRLSMRASRVERQILLRDSSPQVLMGLLNHPRIEDAEILEIVKSSYASAGILNRVAENRKWMQNREIQSAIVRSPKTPPTVAQKLLPGLPTEELRVLSKMGNARETLRKAALRVYLQRTQGRKSDI